MKVNKTDCLYIAPIDDIEDFVENKKSVMAYKVKSHGTVSLMSTIYSGQADIGQCLTNKYKNYMHPKVYVDGYVPVLITCYLNKEVLKTEMNVDEN